MYLWYIFDFLSSFTVIYVFLIANIPIVQQLFPDVIRFIVGAVAVVFLVSDLIGYAHYHKMGTYAAEQDIAMENSPYTTIWIAKNLLPFMEVINDLGHGRPPSKEVLQKCQIIVEESNKRWAEKK